MLLAAVKIDKLRIGCLFKFGKCTTRDGDVSIVGKHFCAGYIEAIRKIIYIYYKEQRSQCHWGTPLVNLLALDNAPFTLHFWDLLRK